MKSKTKKFVEIEKNASCKNCSDDKVPIRSDAFAFCRYGVMLLAWVALIFHLKWLVLVIFVILLLSAILTVKYSPMIMLYNYTFGLFIKSKTENLGIGGMRFAHSLGTFLSGLAVLFLYFGSLGAGWGITLFLAIMKTISAVGLCPAYKLYNCMKSGGCCSFSRYIAK
ncbi:MAG: DUF4395 family protein [archaeon]